MQPSLAAKTWTSFALIVAAFLVTGSSSLAGQQGWPGRDRLEAERCTPASGDGTTWLQRAESATGMDRVEGAVQFVAFEGTSQFFQSDRMYPPYIGSTSTTRYTFDPRSGAERSQTLVPGGGTGRDLIRTASALLTVRDTLVAPFPAGFRFFEPARLLNPLAVLADWRGAPATVVAHCVFRDFSRIVLSRGVAGERLYLHEGSGVPVKYERVEPHYLWGQVLAEYVYTTWWGAGPVMLPFTSVRYLDGVEETRRDLRTPQTGSSQLGSAVALSEAWPALPSPLPDHRPQPGLTEQTTPVDTVRVDANTVLLVAPAYTHAVTSARDTVYLFDATTAEWRSRADSVLIQALFPRHRAVVLVVTDLAWPHVAGVRFWAARGASIATHPLSIPFLRRVVERNWTLKPDLRGTGQSPAVRWIPVERGQSFGGGAVRLAPINGVASEGALMAWVPGAQFLWAGDYIQGATSPTVYAREVMAAVQREGFTPTQVAAQHLRLTPWTAVLEANRSP